MDDYVVPQRIRELCAGDPIGLARFVKRARADRQKTANEKAADAIRAQHDGYFVLPVKEKGSTQDSTEPQLKLPF